MGQNEAVKSWVDMVWTGKEAPSLEIFIHENCYLKKFAKNLPHENFPLYGIVKCAC